VNILNAKYDKAVNVTHLSPDQQEKILEVLTEFEGLFDGTLGDWKTKLVSFEGMEGGGPYYGRHYPVPKVHKETQTKKLNRLCKLRVLRSQPTSDQASLSL
jgi:hypothetical protein